MIKQKLFCIELTRTIQVKELHHVVAETEADAEADATALQPEVHGKYVMDWTETECYPEKVYPVEDDD